jgi:hypothetical protein
MLHLLLYCSTEILRGKSARLIFSFLIFCCGEGELGGFVFALFLLELMLENCIG